MVYQDYNKEDIKQESYQIIAGLLMEAVNGLRAKDPNYMLTNIEAIYYIIWNRIDNPDDLQRRIEDLNDMLYRFDFDDDERPALKSQALDEGKKVLKELTKVIDKEGLLFGVTVNPGELITKGR